jgi:putative DNA primase/helicase
MSKVIPMPTQSQAIEDSKPPVMFNQMKTNQRAVMLKNTLRVVAMGTDGLVYRYHDGIWSEVDKDELYKTTIALFDEHETSYSKKAIDSVIDTMKITIKTMREPRKGVVCFANGVYDIQRKQFEEHSKDNWLTASNGVTYREVDTSKPPYELAPSFYRWLNHASEGSETKRVAIMAGLYMVLANRYDWQLFLEITGKGGTGKSVFMNIARMLVGSDYETACDMYSLDKERSRSILVNKQLITLPDQPKYIGGGSGIKAITGGDAVSIDPKYRDPFSTVIRAVVIATNNVPMYFTERNGGIARRRVIIGFNNVVPDSDKDPQLIDKIQSELPEVINYLISRFSTPELAKDALRAQARSYEALEVKRQADPLYDFFSYFQNVPISEGMFMGNANAVQKLPRRYIYHAYGEYMASQSGNGLNRALSVKALAEAMDCMLEEIGIPYDKRRFTHGFRYNITLTEEANDWLPKGNEV